MPLPGQNNLPRVTYLQSIVSGTDLQNILQAFIGADKIIVQLSFSAWVTDADVDTWSALFTWVDRNN